MENSPAVLFRADAPAAETEPLPPLRIAALADTREATDRARSFFTEMEEKAGSAFDFRPLPPWQEGRAAAWKSGRGLNLSPADIVVVAALKRDILPLPVRMAIRQFCSFRRNSGSLVVALTCGSPPRARDGLAPFLRRTTTRYGLQLLEWNWTGSHKDSVQVCSDSPSVAAC